MGRGGRGKLHTGVRRLMKKHIDLNMEGIEKNRSPYGSGFRVSVLVLCGFGNV